MFLRVEAPSGALKGRLESLMEALWGHLGFLGPSFSSTCFFIYFLADFSSPAGGRGGEHLTGGVSSMARVFGHLSQNRCFQYVFITFPGFWISGVPEREITFGNLPLSEELRQIL